MLHLTALLAGALMSAPPAVNVKKIVPASFPFRWPAPEGWRTETIPFPLEFAPSIPYTGVEELRFAPGFGKPDRPDYFTYAFVWVIEADGPPPVDEVARHLETYFDGLMTEVGRSKDKGWPAVQSKVELTRQKARAAADALGSGTLMAWPYASGTVKTVDAFFTQKPLKLTVEVSTLSPPLAYRQALYFSVSPNFEKNSDAFMKLHAALQH